MKARFLRYESVVHLRSRIRENLELYRGGDFQHLAVDTGQFFEIPVEIDESAWDGLLPPSGTSLYDPENCIVLYTSMSAISPSEARDERLWTYLTHTDLLQHSRLRWPIPADASSVDTSTNAVHPKSAQATPPIMSGIARIGSMANSAQIP